MTNKRLIQAAALTALMALTISSTGCGSDKAATNTGKPGVSSPSPSQSAAASASATAATVNGESPTPSGQEKLAAATNNVSQAGAENKVTPSGTAKPKKVFDPYSIDKPLLMGIAIGESMDDALKLHGNPNSTYVMEDPDAPLTVHEYDDFNVGYNKKRLAEFVEVSKPDVDSGLNGLRLGQTTAEAAKALGKPDSSTDYVMTYKTKQTILKLDVDTKNKTIQSIKLFSRDE